MSEMKKAIWRSRTMRSVDGLAPAGWFAIGAVFHYLGPSFAVLLFARIGVLGIAWLRIISAAICFALVTRPWRLLGQIGFGRAGWRELSLLLSLGTCLALMNCSFYLALARLPISLVAMIEFVGTIGIALYGLRTKRNLLALALAVVGVAILVDVRWSSDPAGLFWGIANAVLFVLYIVLGHRIAATGAGSGIECLGAAMLVAAIVVLPIGLGEAMQALSQPALLFAAIGVGICSSVIPYVCDQIVLARLPRASFALWLTALPASATIIGAIVLQQVPTLRDLIGIAMVMSGVAMHRAREAV